MRPGNRYARERGLSRTLGKMALGAICGQSKNQRVLYRFGAGCPAIELGRAPMLQQLPQPYGDLHESAR